MRKKSTGLIPINKYKRTAKNVIKIKIEKNIYSGIINLKVLIL